MPGSTATSPHEGAIVLEALLPEAKRPAPEIREMGAPAQRV
jgi:hypothetical protein